MDRSIETTGAGPLDASRRQEWETRRLRRESGDLLPALGAVLEKLVLPRLMSAHRMPTPSRPILGSGGLAGAEPGLIVRDADVQALVEASLHPQDHRAGELVRQLKDQGVPIETLYLDLITPAARRIGAMWEADTCDFVLVTLAVLRIQQVMYDLSPAFVRAGATPSGRRLMVTPMPGSQHTLGAAMVADFFRRDGWDVESAHDLSRAGLIGAVRAQWFDVVALSIAAPAQLVGATTLISDIRKLSSNRGILVLVGGPVALSVPDLAARVGADAATLDAKEAVEVAGRAVPVRGPCVVN